MKTIQLLISIILLIICNVFDSTASGSDVTDSLDRILLNQVGYKPNAQKVALLRINTPNFEVVNFQNKKVVFTGKTGAMEYWKFSDDSVCTADFSTLTKPGKYQVRINKNIYSPVFEIGNNVYTNISKWAVKSYYLQRTGMEIKPEFGGKWARPASHPDTAVIVHASAASPLRPEGTIISSPGGWFDAGDYNKYIVNSSITTYTLMLFCQLYPEYCKKLNLQIPESNNNIPDVLDELLYNLRWMLTMQDPNDGGVYHKLTNKNFDPMIMPEKATQPRYVVTKSTSAALDFTATMCMAYRLLGSTGNKELENLAVTCRNAAHKAYAWVKSNPVIYFKNPEGFHTGQYDDVKLKDEYFWAAAEMALAHDDPSMVTSDDMRKQMVIVPSWDTLGMLGVISLALTNNPKFENLKSEAQKILLGYVDELVNKSEFSAYKVSLDFFKWGSNSDVANMAMLKLIAGKIKPVKKYFVSAQGDVDYLLGRNATGYCFVTGFGNKKVMHIHHRQSVADGIDEPYPGFLAGGPNLVTFGDCGDKAPRPRIAAKSFVDADCSYSTNEIAINWNAPLVFILGAFDAMK